MILGDLFEGKMNDLDIQYQDWKNMSPVAFLSRYKMTKDQWYAKHQSLVPAEGSVQEVFAPVVAIPQQPKRELTPAQEKSADRDVKLLGKYRDKDLGVNAAINRLEKFKQKHSKGIAEDDVEDFLKAGGTITQVAPQKGPRRPGLGLASKHIGGSGDRMTSSRTGRASQPIGGKLVGIKEVESTAKERWNQASAEREKKHNEIEARRQAAAKQGKTDVPGAIKRLEKALGEEGSHRFKGPHGVVNVDQSKPGVTKVTRHSDVGAKTFSNGDQGRASGIGVGSGSGVSATQGTRRAFPRLNIDGPELNEQTQELSIGDPVIISGTEYDGKTGEVKEFSPSGKFVVVDLYNYGPQAFSMANVNYNEYADDEGVVETFIRPETAREQQVQLLARTYAELYWGDRSITARASTAREIFNAVMSGELDTATLKMEIRALEQEHDISEEQDACYRKVKSRYKVWPSAYASGALVQCRKKGAANWGNKTKK